jgi:hypothetical protein
MCLGIASAAPIGKLVTPTQRMCRQLESRISTGSRLPTTPAVYAAANVLHVLCSFVISRPRHDLQAIPPTLVSTPAHNTHLYPCRGLYLLSELNQAGRKRQQ